MFRLSLSLLLLACSTSISEQADLNLEPGDAGEEQPAQIQIEIRRPEQGLILGGVLEILAVVNTSLSLRGVEFKANGERVEMALQPPYRVRWDSRAAPDGEVRLTAIAISVEGKSVQDSLNINLDNSPPQIQLIHPRQDSPILYENSGFELSFRVEDRSPLSSVFLEVNGLSFNLSEGPEYRSSLSFEALGIQSEDLPIELSIFIEARDERMLRGVLRSQHPVRKRVRWRYEALGAFWARPSLAEDGTLYLNSIDGFLHAVREGQALWIHQLSGETISSPALHPDGTVYVSSGTQLFAVKENQRLWSRDLGGTTNASPTLHGDRIYVGTYGEELLALDLEGEILWRFPTGGPVLSKAQVGPDGLIYVGSHDRSLYALNPDGSLNWSQEIGGEIWAEPLLSLGQLIITGRDGYIYAYDALSGALNWSQNGHGGEILGGAAEGPDGKIFIANQLGELLALSPLDGSSQWLNPPRSEGFLNVVPAVDALGRVFVGDAGGKINAFSAMGELLWSLSTATDNTFYSGGLLSADLSLFYIAGRGRQLLAVETGFPSARCPEPEMVSLGTFSIMKYEASRPDAQALDPGQLEHMACSLPNLPPWSGASWNEATIACAGSGMRLCSAAEWRLACMGAGLAEYPYGAEHDPNACNGLDHPQTGCQSGECRARRTGSLSHCRSSAEVWDMSGNLMEWSADRSEPLGDSFRLALGGSYASSIESLSCSFDEPAQAHLPLNSHGDDLGFRCCR